ncbi:MAG: hypothetical protein ABFS28_12460 [Bacteroidota bacterium]
MRKLIKKVLRKYGIEISRTAKQKPNIYNQISKYSSLNEKYRTLLSMPNMSRGNYVWGAICGADLASNLNLDKISFIEFGVAGGNGLIELETIAIEIEKMYNISVDVFGFDTGKGLTKPVDYRDLPHLWNEGFYPMDVEKLQGILKKSKLILGDIKDTIDDFIVSKPAPIAFISFDMDLYTPTVEAFKVFEDDNAILLPRVHCYFDDIMGYSYSEYNGERLAISEFNQKFETKKISPIYCLEHYIENSPDWAKKIYMAHFFDHGLYNTNDGMLVQPDLPLPEQA